MSWSIKKSIFSWMQNKCKLQNLFRLADKMCLRKYTENLVQRKFFYKHLFFHIELLSISKCQSWESQCGKFWWIISVRVNNEPEAKLSCGIFSKLAACCLTFNKKLKFIDNFQTCPRIYRVSKTRIYQKKWL